MPSHLLLMSFDGDIINLNNTLDRFFEYGLALLPKKKDINFCYIGTAANDRVIEDLFFRGFIKAKFGAYVHTSKLLLTSEITQEQIEKHLTSQDIVFVGGGNTEQMLKTWQNKGFIAVLDKLKQEDKLPPVVAGVSSGGMYPFHSGLTDSIPGQYNLLPCLNWMEASFCAHADSKNEAVCPYDHNKRHTRMSAYISAVKSEQLPEGYAVPNNCMLHFYNFTFVRALSTCKNTNCYNVTKETVCPIETIYLTSNNIHSIANKTLTTLHLISNNPEQNEVQIRANKCSIM